MYCKYCGSEVSDGGNFCENCGKDKSSIRNEQATIINNVYTNDSNIGVIPVNPTLKKSPGMAAFLSFICTGLGQVYNGQVGKGFIHFVLCVIGMCFYIIPGIIIWIYSIYEAYEAAEEINDE